MPESVSSGRKSPNMARGRWRAGTHQGLGIFQAEQSRRFSRSCNTEIDFADLRVARIQASVVDFLRIIEA